MRSKPPVAVLVALLALVAAAGGVLFKRRRTSAATPAATEPTSMPGGDPSDAPPVEALATDAFTCAKCGHELRRQGQGRHVIYWEPDASSSDPLLDPVCPECGTPLPHEHHDRAA